MEFTGCPLPLHCCYFYQEWHCLSLVLVDSRSYARRRAEQQERRAELQAGIDEYAEAAKEAAAEAKELSQALKCVPLADHPAPRLPRACDAFQRLTSLICTRCSAEPAHGPLPRTEMAPR